MIKQLQRKFVIYAVLISMIVLLIITSLINILNYHSVIDNSDKKLKILVASDFQLGSELITYSLLPQEMASLIKYFIVYTDNQSQIHEIYSNSFNYLTYEQAKSHGETAIDKQTVNGTVDHFRYLKIEGTTGFYYVFLDIESELTGCYNLMISTLVVLGFALILITLFACILSKPVVYPIAQAYEKQKHFITNVSHEFKTPLAIIKADADVLELENDKSEWTQSITNQVSKLNVLVENLISLTRLDEAQADLIKSDFSLSDALSETIDDFFTIAKKNNMTLTYHPTTNITYKGNEESIRKLFTLLIENAIKYTPHNSEIKIQLTHTYDSINFSIENPCDNLKIGKYTDWFDRFYRSDKSRNSKTQGFGIGLSIAKSICKNHKAKINAESKNGKTIVISIVF